MYRKRGGRGDVVREDDQLSEPPDTINHSGVNKPFPRVLPSAQIRDLTFHRFLSLRKWSLASCQSSVQQHRAPPTPPAPPPRGSAWASLFEMNRRGAGGGVGRPRAPAAFSVGRGGGAPPAARRLCFVSLLLHLLLFFLLSSTAASGFLSLLLVPVVFLVVVVFFFCPGGFLWGTSFALRLILGL